MTDIITKYIYIFAVIAMLPILAACGNLQSAAGLDRRSPDEFAVMRSAPLTVPPDFRLPDPAAQSARQSNRSSNRAKTILTGDNTSGTPSGVNRLSDGEKSLLSVAGATTVDPSIRQEINQLDSGDARRPVIEQLQFWRDAGRPPGKAIDPSAELKRLRDQSTDTTTGGDSNVGESPDQQSAPAPTTTPTSPPLTTPDNS